MVKHTYEIEVMAKNGTRQKVTLRRFKKDDAPRLYKSWSNPQNYRFNEIPRAVVCLPDGTVITGIESIAQMVDYSWPSEYGQYYFVIEDSLTKELIGNVRIGCDYGDKDVWGFGYNLVRQDDKSEYTMDDINLAFMPDGVTKDANWGRGYATAIVKFIINLAREQNIKKVISGADILNFGSIKPMLKNGMEYVGVDDDIDPTCEIDLTKPTTIPTEEELDKIWKEYLQEIEEIQQKYKSKLAENTQKHYQKAVKIWQEGQWYKNQKGK